ncbi:MAG: hypothetical protein PGN11_07200 [Quadrisphaera sp.]
MIPTRHRALRAALLLVPAVVVAGLLGVHRLGVVSARTAPDLEPLRVPLDLAAAGGGALVLVAAALTWRWSHLAAAADRPTEQAVRALRHLRLAVAVVGLHLAVCTVGMSAVLDRRGYGMPGLWLLALLAEAGLAALVVGLGRAQREARTEVVHDRRTGRVPQPR